MRRDTWMGLGIAGVACLLMCAGTAVTAPGTRTVRTASEPARQPRLLLAQSGYGAPATSQDSMQPAAGTSSPPQEPATQTPATDAGIGGAGTATQQAPVSGPLPEDDPSNPEARGGANPNPAVNPAGPNENTGAVANPNAASTEGSTVPPNPGTGSAATPGTNPDLNTRGTSNAGTGGTGNSGTGAPAAAPAPAAREGIAVVDAIYRGIVTSVSPKEVVIVDAGTRLPLEIGTGTRILRDGQAIRVNQLKEGEKVRAVVNIVGKSHTREIAVLSGAEARRAVGLKK